MHLRRKHALWLLAAFLLTAGATAGRHWYLWQSRLVRVGEVRLDPLRQLDPAKHYDVVVWDVELYVPGVSAAQRRAALEAAAAELAEVFPNIAVTFVFHPAEGFAERVRQALEAGVGPDIAALYGTGMLLDRSKQVPVTAYLGQETTEDILPSVRQALDLEGDLWAWPRWVTLSLWSGTAKHLGELPGVPAPSAADLLRYGGAWRAALGGRPPVAYNLDDPDLFRTLAVAAAGRPLLNDAAAPAWTRAAVEEAAQVLAELAGAELLVRDPATAARTRLREFWEGRAAIIAPINAALLRHVLTRSGDLTHDAERTAPPDQATQLVLTAAPHPGDGLRGVWGRVAAYAVFLREPHAGDDHTQAAMLVARHLSRRAGAWEAAVLPAVPAYASALSSWETDSGLARAHVAALTSLVQRLVGPPVDWQVAAWEEEIMAAVFLPGLPRLVRGELTPGEYTELVWRDLHAFLAARAARSSAL